MTDDDDTNVEDVDVVVGVEDVETDEELEAFSSGGSPTTSSCRSSCLLPDWLRCSPSPLPDPDEDDEGDPEDKAANSPTKTLLLFSMVNVTMSVAAPRTVVRRRTPLRCGLDLDAAGCLCLLGLLVTGVSGGVGGVSWTESGRKRTAC